MLSMQIDDEVVVSLSQFPLKLNSDTPGARYAFNNYLAFALVYDLKLL
jgi:hypothetical protein